MDRRLQSKAVEEETDVKTEERKHGAMKALAVGLSGTNESKVGYRSKMTPTF